MRNLVLGDFTGRVYAVNPSADAVAGDAGVKSVGEIPGEVDVAIVAVPAEAVQDVVLDCAAKGVHGLVVISSGFAETGEEGRQRQRRLVGLSRSYGLRLIGPNALGVINTDPDVSLNASLSPVMPPRGRAGFFCQSGALGSAILEKVQNRGLGLSTFVSAGNRADVSGNDLLQYWEEDDATEVVLLYLESIGNPRKFSAIARRVCRRKPIVAVRSGRTTQGVPMGHAVRKIAAPAAGRRRDVPAGRDHPGRRRWRRCSTSPSCSPTSRCRAGAGSRSSATPTRSGCSPPTPPTRSGLVVNSRSRSAPTHGARTSRTPSTARSTTPRSTRSSRSSSRRSTSPAREDVANVLAAVGEQSDKPVVSTFLGAEGVPELLRVPDVAGSSRRPRVRAVVPRRRGGGAGARPRRGVRRVAAGRRRRRLAELDAVRRATRRRQLVNELLMSHPEGRDLDFEEQHRAARAPTASSCGTPTRSQTARGGRRRRARRSAGTSCSRRPPTTCASAPTSPTSGATSTTPTRWRTPGARSTS